MAKAKYLVEGTEMELLTFVLEGLENVEDPKKVKKATNCVKELIERQPQGEPTVEELAQAACKNINLMVEISKQVEQMVEDEIDEVVAQDEEPEPELIPFENMTKKELKQELRDRGLKIGKKASKEEMIALLVEGPQPTEEVDDIVEEEPEPEVEDVSDESSDENADIVADVLSELKLKDIKEIAKKLDIDIKGKKAKELKKEIVANEKALDVLAELDYVEFEEEPDDEPDYEGMSKKELKQALKELGYKVNKGATREEMLEILNK
jgi:SAP domain.